MTGKRFAPPSFELQPILSDRLQGKQPTLGGWETPLRHERKPGRGCYSKGSLLTTLEGKDQPPKEQISGIAGVETCFFFLLHEFSFSPFKINK